MQENVSVRDIEAFMRKKLGRLNSQPQNNTAMFAELRRGIGKQPGEVPQLWGYFLEGMPESFYGDAQPSKAEWAIYVAITLYALHQQGNNASWVLQEKQSIGVAFARLIVSDEDRERITRRFNILATASSIEELTHYLRGAVQLLRDKKIGLDYVRLAGELYRFQYPQQVANVRLRWGQDFYRPIEVKNNKSTEGQEEAKK
jgi:CRISPR system Cascade subunit CasB